MQIRLRFVDEPGFFPGLIKAWSWSSISHVEFAFADGYLSAYYPEGVKLMPLNYAKPKQEWFAHIEVTPEQAKIVEGFAREQLNKPYSLLGIIGFIIKHDFNKKGSWFCSELIYAAFEEAGIELLTKMDIDRISPRDLFESPLLVFEGDAV